MSAAEARAAETGGVTLDLLGRPLRDLRISVTDRCNFRCTYCMPREIYGAAFGDTGTAASAEDAGDDAFSA